MATVTIRYFYKGPWPLGLKNATDPGLTLPAPQFVVAYDVVFDDLEAPQAGMDEAMRHYGCFPDTQNTIAVSPTPFLGLLSPDGNVWKLVMSDLGILTTQKVS